MAKPCHKQASPRHGFVFKATPTTMGYLCTPIPEEYAATLDCIYEMALDIVGANAVTPQVAVARVLMDENWRGLPTHVRAIIERIEIEG